MNDEMLVKLVRERPVLYNIRDPQYMHAELKGRMWKEIGHKMNTDGSKCKARWNNIRDNYRKSLNKRRATNEKSGKTIRPYRYEKHLEFLKEFMDEREPKAEFKMSFDIEAKKEEETLERTTDYLGSPEPCQQDFEIMKYKPTSSSVVIPKPTLLSAKKKRRHESATSTLMKYLLPKIQEEKNSNTIGASSVSLDNPVEIFLHGLSPTLKSLSPYLLNLAKSEIFATVQKYELQMITEQTNCPTPPEISS